MCCSGETTSIHWFDTCQVGWIPNYLRHVVAQMLIEYLDITWKRGLDAFSKKGGGVIQENGKFQQHEWSYYI